MKIVVLILVVLIGGVLAMGALLPRRHAVSRSLLINCSPGQVYALLRDVSAASQWRPGVQRVELLGLVGGRERFREHSKDGAVTYEVVREQPDRELITQIVDTNLGYSGSWTYTLTHENGGTRLTITENGDVQNIIFRFMSRFIFGHAATIDRTLAALAQHYRASPAPDRKSYAYRYAK